MNRRQRLAASIAECNGLIVEANRLENSGEALLQRIDSEIAELEAKRRVMQSAIDDAPNMRRRAEERLRIAEQTLHRLDAPALVTMRAPKEDRRPARIRRLMAQLAELQIAIEEKS